VAVKVALKAMGVSSKVSVRTDGEGVLSMNFMVEVEGNKNVFVEFRVQTLQK
jgi:cell cycle checkpoint protein